MQKLFAAFVTVLIVSTSVLAGGKTSYQTWRDFMNDPFLNKAYQAAQGMLLRTSPDQRMAAFFDTDPLLQSPEVQDKLNTVLEQGITESINTGLATMKRVTAASNPKLYNRWVTVLSRLGFSDKQIENAFLFRAQGEINAYDTSAFQDHLVVVVYNSLDDIMDGPQEASVFGHEAGHDLAKHVLRGIEHVAMTIQLGNRYAQNGNFAGFDDLKKLKKYEFYRHELAPYQQVFWDRVFTQFKLNYMNSETKGASVYNAVKDNERDTFVNALQVIHDEVKSHPDLGSMSVAAYLKNMVISLDEMDVPRDVVQYYEGLLQNLANAQYDQKDPQQFTEYMLEGIANAGGKALESTADRYGQIVTDPARAATTDLVFKGPDLDPIKVGRPDLTRLQLIDLNQKETVDDWVLLHQLNTQEELLEVFGRDPKQNHPLAIKRIIDMMNAARSAATIGLSNPFLKSVILYDELVKQAYYVQEELSGIAQSLKSAENQKLTAEQQRMVSRQVKSIQTFLSQTQAAAEKVGKQVLELMTDPAMSRVNPRLTDYIDYELALRQAELAEFDAAAVDVTSPEDKKELAEIMSESLRLHQTPLLAQIKEFAAKGAPQGAERAAEIDLIANPKATAKDIEAARTKIAKETQSLKRKTRVPVDLKPVLVGTKGPIGDVQPKASEAEKDPAGAQTGPKSKWIQPTGGKDLTSLFQQCELVMKGF